MAAGRADVRLIEGDGWANWSELATLLGDLSEQFATILRRVL
jgi:hypothetical protein